MNHSHHLSSLLNSNLNEAFKYIYVNNKLYINELNLSFDLTDYNGVLITYQDTDSVPIIHSVFIPKNYTEKIGGFNSGQFGSNIYRTVSVDNGGVAISESSATDYKPSFIVPRTILALKNI